MYNKAFRRLFKVPKALGSTKKTALRPAGKGGFSRAPYRARPMGENSAYIPAMMTKVTAMIG